MTHSGAIICVGRLYCDLIFEGLPRLPSLGTEVYASGLGLHPGGGAFITAAHLQALGHTARLASLMPGTPFDGVVTEAICSASVDVSLCAPAGPGADPQITVALLQGGDRAFVTRRSGPAIPPLGPGALRGARHMHIGELATLTEAPWLLDVARGAGLSVSLDCSWDETLSGELSALIGAVDVFLPNAAEVAHLKGLGLTVPMAPLTVVKQGAEGATAYDGSKSVHAPADRVQVVDTTGAGDAFNAGFLDRWLAGAPVQACLAAGHACAARAISYLGGFQAMPVDAAIKEVTL